MLMNAASYDRIGSAREVLTVQKREVPEPGPGEVRVRIALSGVNPSDVKSRSGFTPRPIDGFQIPHMDGVGHIDALGDGVGRERLGQRVWLWLTAFSNRWGTAAEYCVLKADQAVPLPLHRTSSAPAWAFPPSPRTCACFRMARSRVRTSWWRAEPELLGTTRLSSPSGQEHGSSRR